MHINAFSQLNFQHLKANFRLSQIKTILLFFTVLSFVILKADIAFSISCQNVISPSRYNQLKDYQQQYRALARSIRQQFRSRVSHENIMVSPKYLKDEIQQVRLKLIEKTSELPDVAGLNIYTQTPMGPDKRLARMVIERLDKLSQSAQVNYLQTMETFWISTYIFSAGKTNVVSDIMELEISLVRKNGDSFDWNIDQPQTLRRATLPAPTLLERWKKLDNVVPIYTHQSLSRKELQMLWARGIAPIGVSFEPSVSFDSVTTDAFLFGEHDWAHTMMFFPKYANESFWARIKSKYNGQPNHSFYKLFLKLEQEIFKSSLSETQKEAAFSILFNADHEIQTLYLSSRGYIVSRKELLVHLQHNNLVFSNAKNPFKPKDREARVRYYENEYESSFEDLEVANEFLLNTKALKDKDKN